MPPKESHSPSTPSSGPSERGFFGSLLDRLRGRNGDEPANGRNAGGGSGKAPKKGKRGKKGNPNIYPLY